MMKVSLLMCLAISALAEKTMLRGKDSISK